jgi:alkylation response protein AidB-like acyl-CoA dehydrogenase
MGMRATRSDDTILDGAFVPDRYVARIVPAGAAGIDQFVLSVLMWALVGFGNIYYGVARRALDMTLDQVKKKHSLALTRSMAYHPEVQHGVAEMGIELEGIGPQLNRLADDWCTGVDHGAGSPSSSPRSIAPWRRRGAWWIARWISAGASASSAVPDSSGSSAMHASVASTPPTRCSRTRSSASLCWASARTSSRGGGERGSVRA